MFNQRKLAAEQGQTKYIGKECRICGNPERYVSNNNCFECSKKHAKAYDQRTRELLKELRESKRRS